MSQKFGKVTKAATCVESKSLKAIASFPDPIEDKRSDPANYQSGKKIVQHQDPGVTDLQPHKIRMYCLVLGHKSDSVKAES